MAKSVAPLLSFSASGTIAKTQVYSSWRGRGYVRRYTTPANPNTADQVTTRSVFSWLQAVFKVAPVGVQAVWQVATRGKPLTDRNQFTKSNLPALRPETDLALFLFSNGALGGLPPIAVVTTPGNDQLSVAVTPPTPLPAGWSIVKAHVAVILDQDPHVDADYTIGYGTDLSDPYTVLITGLTAALYRVGAWFEFLRPDGSTAYSPQMASSGTPT